MRNWMLLLAIAGVMVGCQPSGPDSSYSTTGEATVTIKEPEPPKDGAASSRAPKDGDKVGVLETGSGRIVFMFFPDVAPKHVERIQEILTKGIWNGTYFHRVIPGFMIQGGDPNTKDKDKANDGQGGWGSMLKAEFNSIPHERGICSMARTGEPNSAQSQIFICHARAASLDNQYTVWGKVVEGMDVVDKIVNLKTENDNPIETAKATVTKATLQTWPLK